MTGPARVCLRALDYKGETCIQRLAGGWCGPNDLCAVCTGRFMAALDGLGEPLNWHPGFVQRAGGAS
jgi:hypothetical protein